MVTLFGAPRSSYIVVSCLRPISSAEVINITTQVTSPNSVWVVLMTWSLILDLCAAMCPSVSYRVSAHRCQVADHNPRVLCKVAMCFQSCSHVDTKEMVDKSKSANISIITNQFTTGCSGYNLIKKQVRAGMFVASKSVQIAHISHITTMQRRW